MHSPEKADFETHLGSLFRVAEGNGAALRLARVEGVPTSLRDGGGFRLEFASEDARVNAQGTYHLATEAFQTDVFLVPIRRDGDTITLEAIFN